MSQVKYNVCLCYHGFVSDPSQDATCRSELHDGLDEQNERAGFV